MVIDFCAYVGNWPTYQLPIRDADGLVEAMDNCGIDLAFVSLAGGGFRFDPGAANAELACRVKKHRARLFPVGIVDLHTPGWEEELRRDIRLHDLAGIRLHVNYSGKLLDAQELTRLGKILAEQPLPLFVAAFIDEERFQHPSIRVPHVTVEQMLVVCRSCPETTIIINNLRPQEAEELFASADFPLDRVFLDINAMDSPFDGLSTLVKTRGSGGLVYGSQLPFLYPESALVLVRQSNLAEVDQQAIMDLNWRKNEHLQAVVHRQLQNNNNKEQR